MRLPLAVLLLLSALTVRSAPRYEAIDLGALPGCFFSRGTDLNDRGQVVGWAETSDNISRAFLWDRGVMTELRIESARETLAVSINNRGEIAGGALIDGKRRTFLWLKDRTLDLGVIDSHPVLGLPGNFIAGGRINENSQVVFSLLDERGEKRTAIWADNISSFPYSARKELSTSGIALNNRHEIAGQLFTWNPATRSTVFLWSKGELRDLGGLGGQRASATAINDAGVIAGWALPSGKDLKQARAFVYSTDSMTSLGSLGGAASRAYGLNEEGAVVGYSLAADAAPSAFLWRPDDGSMRDLNEFTKMPPGWRLSVANAVNNHGQILAQGSGNGKTRAFLLNPVGLEISLRNPPSNAQAPPSERPLTPAVPRPVLARLQRLPDGGVQLSLPASVATGNVVIEYSVNLRDWKPLGRPARQGDLLRFVDPTADQAPLRFYRVVASASAAR